MLLVFLVHDGPKLRDFCEWWLIRVISEKGLILGHDLREYARQTNLRLILGGLLLVFLVGDGLVFLFMGRDAAVSGLICLVIGMIPLVLTWLFLLLLDWVVKQGR
jgi:hypothetical protein